MSGPGRMEEKGSKTMRWLGSIALLIGLCLAGAGADAQDLFIGVGYTISQPTSNSKDFTNNTSWRGFTFEWRKFVQPGMSAGFHLGWNVFDERTTRTSEVPEWNASVSGTQFRYMNVWPVLGNVHYYLGKRGDRIRPFFGGNIGAYIIEQRLELGIVAFQDTKWHFGLAPEGGIAMHLTDDAWWFFNARYNYAFESGDVPSQSYWTFNIGIASEQYTW
jgi:outer membrane protein W